MCTASIFSCPLSRALSFPGSRATICFILQAYDIINWPRIPNRTGWKIEPRWNTFVLSGWWLPGLLFKQPCRLWTGGSRRLLSVFIVISRSRMSSWANLLLLISLTERESWQACRVLSPFQPKTEYNVCSTRGNMINYTKVKFKNATVPVSVGDVLYTSAPRQQLVNQIGDNLCIFRFCAKLYNLRHLLHYAWKAPFWAHIFLPAAHPCKCARPCNVLAAVFGSAVAAQTLSFLTLAPVLTDETERGLWNIASERGLAPSPWPRVSFYPHFSLDLWSSN